MKMNMSLSADAKDFIDVEKLETLISNTKEDLPRAREIFKKALDNQP